MIVTARHPTDLASKEDDRTGVAKPPLMTDVRFKAPGCQPESNPLEAVAARGVSIQTRPQPLNASHRNVRGDGLASAGGGRRLERDRSAGRSLSPVLYADRQVKQFGELHQRDGLPAEHAPGSAVQQYLCEAVVRAA